ncbi:MAG: cytochrome c family protein [Acidobacteriia bacterium]|nr:cytochrome c family protein [Terriglobia bacterium]
MKRGIAIFTLLIFLPATLAWREASARAARQGQNAPAARSEPPAQPIPYSHKKHLALGLKCQQCHPNPEPGDRMTLPAAGQCMACHVTIAREKPSIQKLAEFAKSGQAIPWVRFYVVSGWVYWNHRVHLEAKMTCAMCHGPVEEMEVMARATNVTTMAGCIECHRKNDASTGCQYCHADK